jgi:hypothetical protein
MKFITGENMSETKIIDEIKKALQSSEGKWSEKKGLWTFSTTIAERKAFLSTKKLTYTAKIRVDETSGTVRFSEMLSEAGSGLSSGGIDGGISPGFGFKTETYNTTKGSRQGTIEEQSKLFGKDYTYRFDYQEIRGKVKETAEKSNLRFEYQILPVN